MVMETHIPEEEILMDILSSLPVKSLLRFKCVSKSWETLISEPYFKRKHLSYAKNQLSSQKMFFGHKSDRAFYFYCSSLSPVKLVKDIRTLDWPSNSKLASHGLKVHCCCDGLLLVEIWTNIEGQPSMVLLWNPSTGESIVLPYSESPQLESVYGLGYDSISDDYKVFRIDMEYEGLDEILTLKSGCWRKINEISGWSGSLWSGKQCLAFVRGAFHWIGFLTSICVVSFSISDERYGEISLPEMMCLLRISKINVDVGILGRKLCVFYNDETTFNLWIMKDYGVNKSWTKSLTVPINGELRSIIPVYMFSDDVVLLRQDDWDKPIYRISEGSSGLSNQIWPLDCDDFDAVNINQDGFVYTESLISPKSDSLNSALII